MRATLLILLVIGSVIAGHHDGHSCVHHKLTEKYGKLEISEATLNEEDAERHLQNAAPRKMKITYDMSFFNGLQNTPENQLFKRTAEKAIKIAISYFTEILSIIPKPAGQMKWDLRSSKCGEATVPQIDKQQDKDADLHLYVTYTNEPKETYLAYAMACRFLKIYGPTHGQVNFNQGIIGNKDMSDPIAFQDFIQTTIHEILHVLGFSEEVYSQWVDANKKPHVNPTTTSDIRGVTAKFIRTPNVLKAAKEYYGCQNIPGMPLETHGDSGSAGSHWSTTAIFDEMMNAASSATNSIMSVFTIALLKDTGFYAAVNDKFIEPSFYGKDEGCAFVTGQCDTTKREFCKIGSANSCDFYNHGSSKCRDTEFTDSGCSNYQAYSNVKCFDVNNAQNSPGNVQAMGTSFGSESKCFMSSLIKKDYVPIQKQPSCYNFQCTPDSRVIIKIGSSSAMCSKNGEQVTLAGFNGTISCPDKLEEFCSYKKMCPKHCSSNGYCLNGTCLCVDTYKGADCSTPK